MPLEPSCTLGYSLSRMVASLRVFIVGTADAPRVLDFYRDNPDKHLMPRPLKTTSFADSAGREQRHVGLKDMALAKELYAAEDDAGKVVGVAYLHEPEPDAAERGQEFGGIYFAEALRRTGVPLDFCAVVLGTVIASSVGEYVPSIAHTHVANGAPHKVLGGIGFAPTAQNISLSGGDPRCQNMRKSIDGRVWGVVHSHLRPHLEISLATHIRGFSGTFGDPGIPTQIGIDDWDKDDIAEALTQLAKGGSTDT